MLANTRWIFRSSKDVGNVVADAFGAVRTPEVFVLDKQRVVRYHGRVDDQYGVGLIRPEASNKDLAKALEELLGGKEVATKSTPTPGCLIGRVRTANSESRITYSNQISRIFRSVALNVTERVKWLLLP